MLQHRITRRQLLNGLGGTALLSFLGKINVLAQSAPPDYKALVCVFLSGGNDSHNMIVPLSAPEFSAYKAARGSLALPDNNGALLQVQTPNGTPFGLNPGLAALHPLWLQGRLAVLANTGMLVQPVTRAEYLDQRGAGADEPVLALGSDSADAERLSLDIGWNGLGRARRGRRPAAQRLGQLSDDHVSRGSGAVLQRQRRAVGEPVARVQPRRRRHVPVAAGGGHRAEERLPADPAVRQRARADSGGEPRAPGRASR